MPTAPSLDAVGRGAAYTGTYGAQVASFSALVAPHRRRTSFFVRLSANPCRGQAILREPAGMKRRGRRPLHSPQLGDMETKRGVLLALPAIPCRNRCFHRPSKPDAGSRGCWIPRTSRQKAPLSRVATLAFTAGDGQPLFYELRDGKLTRTHSASCGTYGGLAHLREPLPKNHKHSRPARLAPCHPLGSAITSTATRVERTTLPRGVDHDANCVATAAWKLYDDQAVWYGQQSASRLARSCSARAAGRTRHMRPWS